MNFFLKCILIILIVVFQSSCAKEKKVSVLEDKDLQSQMVKLYEEGYEAFLDNDTLFAAKKFNEAELIFPQSDWAPIAALMTAYVYYSDDYYSDAIYHLKRYLKVYPKHKDIDYAHYLLGMCFYENIIDEKRDLGPLLNAKKQFEFLEENYPNTEFSIDAGFKLGLIEDRLAGKEMYIGRHYAKSQKWIAAINRFKNIVDNYETSVYVEEALYRLAEIHFIIGLEGEAKKYASLLGYNYGSSRWYKASYKIFNKDYNLSEKEIFSLKEKDKKSMFKKFKKRFKNLFN
ncbi:outer membrane protein assembly factor BamD [Pelagibacterales bacterium SAG-MED07]|nr:outer membrane protein assembly factor BamD [Pelagibacterales bacterium SAG-MED07]